MKKIYWETYNRLFFKVALGMVVGVIAVNIIVDPGDIYLQKYLKERLAGKFADTLLGQKVAIVEFGNERIVKDALAQRAGGFDCAILGSSQAMQLSTIRTPSSLGKICSSSINLGVSGGSLEDFLVFTYSMVHSANKPKKIILVISPWNLKRYADSRFEILQEKYIAMLKELDFKGAAAPEPYSKKLIRNLINKDYFVESLKAIGGGKVNFNEKFEVIKDVDYQIGYEKSVILADGSYLYPKETLEEAKKSSQMEIKGGIYGIHRPVFHPDGLLLLKSYVDYVKRQNIELILVIVPYHEVVFSRPQYAPDAKFLASAETIIHILAKDFNVKLFGSYDPKKIGCSQKDFINYFHPSTECINKIDFNLAR